MADQRPPRHNGSPSRTPSAALRPSPAQNNDNNTSAPDQPSLSTQSSFQSLEPYDERNLRDCEHTPKRQDWNAVGNNDTSHATSSAERTVTANDALHMPSISSTSRNKSDKNRRQNLITRRSAPEFIGGHSGGDYYGSPVMKSGHRRRRPTGSGSSVKAKEHQSPKPHYSNRHATDGPTPSIDPPYSTKQRSLSKRSSTSRHAAFASASFDSSANANAASLLPVLRALCHALFVACSNKCQAISRNCKFVVSKTVGRRWVRYILYALCIVITFLLICLSMAVYGFYQEATMLCTPPPSYHSPGDEPPLIEYFVHGRGNGHYARSVAVIEKLNDSGVDVRMFIGRATMWRAVHESHISSTEAHGKHGKDSDEADAGFGSSKSKGRGVTTAIAVTSITPAMGIFDTLSHILERIIGDCEVAHQTGRYPTLVVTDGDVPGMLRAWFGSVPSVGISHGQTFAIGRKPQFIKSDTRLNAAWNKQQGLNWRAAFLTNWQIGTSFAAMDARRPSGVIAMSPMRPEAIGMAKERWRRSHVSEAGDLIRSSNSTHNVAATLAETYLTQEQREKIDQLLLGQNSHGLTERPRRKLVICYFRDKNGDVMQNALLRSGFDVLLFERGYHKGLMNIQGVEKFGHKWIVKRENENKDELTEMNIEDYWKTMLEGTNAKLLEDGSTASTNTTDANEGKTIAKDNGESDFNNSENSIANEPRIIRVTDMSLFIPLLSIADGVASSAGSQLISECIYSGTPLLSLYRANDDEQMLNVMIYRNLIANDKEMDPTGIGKVVHGIAHEEFSDAFSFLAVDDVQTAARKSDIDLTRETTTKILTKEQEFLLLRNSEAKRAYKEFDDFVDAIARSKVSSSYYEEARVGRRRKIEMETSDRQNPFQGMPDVAPVMLEILKEVIGEQT